MDAKEVAKAAATKNKDVLKTNVDASKADVDITTVRARKIWLEE